MKLKVKDKKRKQVNIQILLGAIFRESIFLGTFEGSTADARHIIEDLRDDFPGSSYHLIKK